jgi:hypothetical protein
MFNNILIPISSEFYQKNIFLRGTFLAEKFNSATKLIYIIEEKTLNQTEKRLNLHRTDFDKEETKKEIIRRHIHIADTIIFEDAKRLFAGKNIPFNGEIIEGEFSAVIKGQINRHKYDLILMGFEKGCLLNYRLFDEVNAPIWIESGSDNNSILAVCSNLAPNQKVPEMGIRLSKELGWDLQMLYIVDTQDLVEVDQKGERSEKKSENQLLARGQQFVSEIEKKGIDVKLVRGSIEKETVKAAENIGAGLIILGREQKKKNMLGIPTKGLKKKMAETCKYSILFVR